MKLPLDLSVLDYELEQDEWDVKKHDSLWHWLSANNFENLENHLRDRFGSMSAISVVPIAFPHSIGKPKSSLPGIYLEGTYPTSAKGLLNRPSEGLTLRPSGLLSRSPNRGLINRKSATFDAFQDLKAFLAVDHLESEEKLKKFELDRSKIAAYLESVDRSKSAADSALARFLIDKTYVLSDYKEMKTLMHKSWQQFWSITRGGENAKYILCLPSKAGSDWLMMHFLSAELLTYRWAGTTPTKHVSMPMERTDVDLVLVDDAAYSGTHIINQIDAAVASLATSHPFVKVRGVHLIIPLLTHVAMDRIKSHGKTIRITPHFYPVIQMRSVLDLAICEKDKFESILTSEAARNVRFLNPACSVMSTAPL